MFQVLSEHQLPAANFRYFGPQQLPNPPTYQTITSATPITITIIVIAAGLDLMVSCEAVSKSCDLRREGPPRQPDTGSSRHLLTYYLLCSISSTEYAITNWRASTMNKTSATTVRQASQ